MQDGGERQSSCYRVAEIWFSVLDMQHRLPATKIKIERGTNKRYWKCGPNARRDAVEYRNQRLLRIFFPWIRFDLVYGDYIDERDISYFLNVHNHIRFDGNEEPDEWKDDRVRWADPEDDEQYSDY